jgi:hypothetical protein
MTDIPRSKYLGRRLGTEPKDEAEHFIKCGACGVGSIAVILLAYSSTRPVATSGAGPATVGPGAITGFPAPPAEQGPGTARVESL